MKNKIYLITILLIGTLFNSCESNDNLEHQDKFDASQEAWLDFKESSNNSYKYTVINNSWWTEISMETSITVENGVIIQRDFEYTSPMQNYHWTETGSELGTHEIGADLITLDEVYKKAKNDWLIQRSNTNTYLETENNGIISICGYDLKSCVDDCFVGIRIKSIEFL